MLNSKIYLRTAVVYIRFYSKERLNNHNLIEQEEVIAKFASENGYRILEIFREGNVSGKSFDRPAFKAMTDYIKANKWKVKFLIVIDRGRLSTDRSGLAKFYWFLKRNGIRLVSVLQTMLKRAEEQAKQRS